MTTTARVGVDIVAADKTAAAFASVRKNVTGFAGGLGVLKGAIAGAFAGFAAGGFVQGMIRGFVNVNKHVDAVKQSFTTVDRAWQQFALNVGRSGLNDAIIRFNRSMAETMVSGRSLAAILGQGLGAAIDKFAEIIWAAGRALEFLGDNIEILKSKLGGFKQIADMFNGQLFDFSDDIRILKALGLDVSAFTQTSEDMNGKLKALPPTFAEVEEATKRAEAQQKKLTDAYRGGIQGLQDYANGLMLQSQTFGMSEGAAAVYTKKFEFLTRMQREGVKLTSQQTAEMNNWLAVISNSSATLEQQKSAFESFESLKESVADTFADIGHVFSSGFMQAFDSVIDKTASVKEAFGNMVSSILRSLTSLLVNRAFEMLLGGYSGGSGGIAGSGTGLIGGLIGNLFGGARAGGGPVEAGRAYLVGEKRPEIFVPRTGGSIVPRVPMGGGGTKIEIIDQRSNAPAIERTQDGAGGVRMIIRDEVRSALSGGGADGAMGARFGVKPSRRRPG